MKNKKESKMKYYSLKNILEKKARYNVIFGERSNGKTYAVLEYGLKKYVENGEELAIVRRWKEDFRGKRGQTMFNSLVENGVVKELTGGKYDSVYYYSGKWYLATFDEKLQKLVPAPNPFAYGFALSEMEHDKSTSYPNVTTICFDEFLTRQYYLPDEFVTFMNVVSTIVRLRNDVVIFMLGNTVNKYCPYFKEMGLTHITDMRKGNIDIYTYGDSGLTVAVEYADSPNKIFGKPSDVYFAFDNPKLEMITGGAWEIAIYPHLPFKYKTHEIAFIYFIEFDGELLQCEVVESNDCAFTYIHRKTTPLKNPESDIIYSMEYSPLPNHFRNIRKPRTKVEQKISEFFLREKIFYQDNEVGEIVRNYLQYCLTERAQR